MDTEEELASIRAALIREPSPPDLRDEQIAKLKSANEYLQHRVLCLSHENRGLYAKIELLRETAQEGSGTTPENSSR